MLVTATLVAFEGIPQQLPSFEHPRTEDTESDLDRLFRLLNHVGPGDGAKMPTGGKHRSLSVGDILTLAESGKPSEHWIILPIGWKRITFAEAVTYLACPDLNDRHILLRVHEDSPSEAT